MIIELFPVILHLSEVENHQKIKDICMEYVEKEYPLNPSTFVDPWDADVFTTYGKNIDLPWDSIFTEYHNNIKDLANIFGITGRPNVTEHWLNAYKKNQNQEIHEHTPGHFAAVHYIKYDQNDHLPTVFLNPYRQVSISNKPSFLTSDMNHVPPTYVAQSFVNVKEGDLLIFPAFLEHKVPRQQSDNLRVTLSFNFNFG